MDTNALHQCFESTLQADPNTRMEAELHLKTAESIPGFISSCLDIVMEPQVSESVKTAAAVFLKNKVDRYWDPLISVSTPIAEDEKPVFRERLIPALIKVSPHCRTILVKVLNLIVSRDFPSKWPGFLDITLTLFQSNDIDSIRTGLTCLLEINKYYRWTIGENRKGLDNVVSTSFASVLNIGNSLVNETSNTAAEMLRDVLKIYKCATFQELPKELQDSKNLADWGNLMLATIRKDLPEEVLKLSEENRESNPWVKCKKWAFANLYRLFYRYASPRKVTRTKNAQYSEFAENFIANYVPEILNVYFAQIELWVGGKIWLGKASLYNILAFLEECINYKETWALLKPTIDNTISHVIFPLLCTSDADIELFESDPEEYIHKQLDMYEDNPTPDSAATNFLVTLVHKRSKIVLPNLLQFVQGIVSNHVQNPQDLALARQQEGALRIMVAIAQFVAAKNSPVVSQMEPFIAQYVFPDFSSPHGFLRARACQVLNHYAEIDFENIENISFAYQRILKCLEDEHLPVQIEAALSLQPFVRHDDVRAALSDRIPEVMTRLLDLANRIDIDAISGIMEEFVEVFSEQLTPFAVDLTRRMCEQLMRLLGELDDQQITEFDIANYDSNAHEDKTMTALGVLTTIATLLLALDNASVVMLEMELILKPVILTILNKRMSEFYAEVFGLMDNFTYCLKSISPTMWSLLPVIHTVFKDDGMEYLSELSPCLDNYLQYGANEIAENPQLAAIFFDMIQTVVKEDGSLGEEDRAIACAVAQKFLLSLKGHVDEYVPVLLNIVISRLSKESSKTRNVPYLISMLEVILASLCYNAPATFAILEQESFTKTFFTLWFEKMEKFCRVYDLKLVILSMLSLFVLDDNQLPPAISSNLSQISKALASIIARLPEALKHRDELNKEFEASEHHYQRDEDAYDDWNDADEDDEDEEREEEDHSKAKEYLNFLDSEPSGFYSTLHGLEEEPLAETILDAVNPYLAVKETFLQLQKTNSARYQLLTGDLTPEEIKIIDDATSSC